MKKKENGNRKTKPEPKQNAKQQEKRKCYIKAHWQCCHVVLINFYICHEHQLFQKQDRLKQILNQKEHK